MGRTHLQAYREMPSATIVAVASSNARKLAGDLRTVSGNLGRCVQSYDFSSVSPYTNPGDLFSDSEVEAVDLCVPTHLHAPLSIAALQAGKHVIVEKPMALSRHECDTMTQASESAGKVLMVAQVIRFWPEYQAAHAWVRENRLGKIHYAEFRRRCGCPQWSNWLPNRKMSGGGVFDLLIHDLDYSLHVFGRPNSISAVGTENTSCGIDIADTHLHYEKGPLVSVSGGWQTRGDFPFSMDFTILGELGALHYHSGQSPLVHYNRNGIKKTIRVSSLDPFRAELEAFISASTEDKPVAKCSPQDSTFSTRMALAMCASRKQFGKKMAP